MISIIITSLTVIGKNYCSYLIPVHNRGISSLTQQGDLNKLFIGSSSFRSNLDIMQLDGQFDHSTFILAYGGNQYIATDIQYDEIKQRSSQRFDTIVIELNPMLLAEEVKLSDTRVTWDLSWEGKKRLWKSMAEYSNVSFPLFYEYFITSGMDDLITYPLTEPFYATRYYKGAKTDNTSPGSLEYLDNEKIDISGLQPVYAQEEALRSLITKCREDGQDFIFLETPHYYRLQDNADYQRLLECATDTLRKNEAPYILASDVDFDYHNPEYFEDLSHMSAAGRTEYTSAVISMLSDDR